MIVSPHGNIKELVDHLINIGALRTLNIIDAFLAVDRSHFVLSHHQEHAYADNPLPISEKATISQPYTVACMLERLQPQVWEKILDVWSGSWRTAALLAQIVWPKWKVYGVELDPELVEFGSANIRKYKFKNVKIMKASKKLGYLGEAPFDKILVSASAHHLPDELLVQLKVGGIMVVPVMNSIYRIKKVSGDEITFDKFDWFVFVPLVH